jgi:hypothetical protein
MENLINVDITFDSVTLLGKPFTPPAESFSVTWAESIVLLDSWENQGTLRFNGVIVADATGLV